MLDPESVHAFLAAHTRGVLVTLKGDGRPQLSNIMYGFFDDRVHISVTDGRAKTRNLARDRRATLHVTDEAFGRYLVVDGTADLTSVTTEPNDRAADLLAATYRSIAGEHPDWHEFRQAMIDQHRLVISFGIEHAYGQGIE